jgi:hypothetical protein
MKTQDREYWQQVEDEMEEAVVDDFNNEVYDEGHIPDLEELSMNCPYEDMSERLMSLARVIHCRTCEREEVMVVQEENYLELCFDL